LGVRHHPFSIEGDLQIIGVDCATQAEKTGIVRGQVAGGRLTLTDRCLCSASRSALDTIVSWVGERANQRTLLALDAPLGWPTALRTISNHVAGGAPPAAAEAMFRRDTDRFVTERMRQRPLDVGADRIARTAHAAITLLESLRQALSDPIPLAWGPDFSGRLAAIEVYPAATLKGRGFLSKGYKKPDQIAERSTIVQQLSTVCEIVHTGDLIAEADVLDAAVCVVAGYDFLTGMAVPPHNVATAHTEGWIWVMPP
jgi:predicted RNase H-like nuclease